MFYVKILLNFYQNCLTLVIAKIKLYVILKNDRLKSHKKGVLSFWQGQKDLNPRHAVLEWSRSIKPSPSKPTVLGHLSKHQ